MTPNSASIILMSHLNGEGSAISRLQNSVRWVAAAPLSLGVGFLVAGLIVFITGGRSEATSGILAYSAAIVSGLVYVWAALLTAYWLAPSHKKIVTAVLSLLILGDLSFVHLVLHGDRLDPATVLQLEEGLGVILVLLRVDDFHRLQFGGVAKIGGALAGLVCAGWSLSKWNLQKVNSSPA